MAGRITAATETQLIVDIREDLRRRRVNLGQQTLTWAYDRFVAPATYQLTYLPYGINVLADNGSVLAEGTDYTVDYTTGLVTFGTGRTSGHVIYVSYVTTGDLIAASGTADTGGIVDTFDRANNASTLGTTSDGSAVWSALSGTWGINSNRGYEAGGAGGARLAVVTAASTTGTLQVTPYYTTTPSGGGLVFRVVDATNYYLWYTGDGKLYDVTGGAFTAVTTVIPGGFPTAWVMRVVLSATSADFYQGGTLLASGVSIPNRSTATKVGLYNGETAGATDMRYDDFSFTS